MLVVRGSKLARFLCEGRRGLVLRVSIDGLGFCVGGRNWLGFLMRVRNRLNLVWASKLTWLQRGQSMLTWSQGGWWHLTRSRCRDDLFYFIVGDRNWLDFSVGIGIDLVFVLRSEMTWSGLIESDLAFVLGGIEIDVILEWEIKLPWPCVGDRNWLSFSMGMQIEFVFACGLIVTYFRCEDRLTWFLCAWLKLAWFLYAGRKRHGLTCASKLTWFLYGWSKATWFQCEWSELT